MWWDGEYLPIKPCRPVSYPEGNVETHRAETSTSDPIEAVLIYYDQRLDIQPYPAEIGFWTRQELPDARTLYTCGSVDINRITTETGCIYVSSSNGTTQIETLLMRSEGGIMACPT
jgi:hypothetical protein